MMAEILCFLCKLVAAITSVFWAVIWSAVVPVEENIQADINWYFMTTLKLENKYDAFHLLLAVHLILIATEVVMLYLQWNCSANYSSYISKGLTAIVASYNIAMTVYLFTYGKKVLSLVSFSLPITGTYLISKVWGFLLLIPLFLAIVLSLPCLASIKKLSALTHLSPCCKCTLVVSLQAAVTLVMIFTVHRGCQACGHDLPAKPTFIAHRGLAQTKVENSVVGFEAASSMESVAVIESDVQLSIDGELFLLHDSTLVRTTTVKNSCPELYPLTNASSLSYNSPPCPLGEVKLTGDDTQHIPKFSQLLQIASRSGKALVFDLYRPADSHPLRKNYINMTLNAVVKSKIDQHKVYWLPDEERLWVRTNYPDLQQIVKTSQVSFDQFSHMGIAAINEEWTTPLETIRKAQSRRLTVFTYVINSPMFFEFFWCAGVDSVATNYILSLDRHNENSLHKICNSSVVSKDWQLGLLSLLFVTVGLFIVYYFTRYSTK